MNESLGQKRRDTHAQLVKHGFTEKQSAFVLDTLDAAMHNAITKTLNHAASLIETSLRLGHYDSLTGEKAADLIARSLRLGALSHPAPMPRNTGVVS